MPTKSGANPALQAQSVARDSQHEAFGDTHLGRNLYLGSGKGQVADDAINRLAAEEFNPRGFRDGVARYDPSFGHVSTIRIEVSFHYTETISVSLTANEPGAGFRRTHLSGFCCSNRTRRYGRPDATSQLVGQQDR
jgi:hypothetical protein